MAKPVIGITGPNHGGGAAWFFTSLSVRLAGGMPVRITPDKPVKPESVQGLILGGGADVHPKLYGEEKISFSTPDKPREESLRRHILNIFMLPITWLSRKIAQVSVNTKIDSARDGLEYALLKYALEKNIPVLGICRGEQLLNVFCGGTLHQGLKTFYVEEPEVRTFFPRKKIKVVKDTHLAKILGDKKHRVNGLHLQGVRTLGKYLQVSAYDRNGIIQAIEHTESSFVLGVQWHPEYLPQLAEQRAIFETLVERCGVPLERSVST